MKQLYRQYSTTFKNINNNQPFNRKSEIFKQNLIKSSGLPLNISNSLNNLEMRNYAFYDKFNNSQAKSIIEKLMQTKDLNTHTQMKNTSNIKHINNQQIQEQEAYLMKELQHFNINYLHSNYNFKNLAEMGSIQISNHTTLNDTEDRVFRQIINLLTDIQEIKEIASKQIEDVNHLKIEMKESGLNWPFQYEQTQANSMSSLFHRYKQEELQAMFTQNQLLQQQIQALTKQSANRNVNLKEQQFQQTIKINKKLLKELANAKSDIRSTGQIDEDEVEDIKQRINSLEREYYMLEQRKHANLIEREQELAYLKSENNRLRSQTIQILRTQQQRAANPRKDQLIHILQVEEQNREQFKQEIMYLKQYYNKLTEENGRLKHERLSNTIQLESKVIPVYENQSAFNFKGMNKQNDNQNHSPVNKRLKVRQTHQKVFLNNQYEDNRYPIENNYSRFSIKSYGNIQQTRNDTGMENRLSQYEDFLNKMRQTNGNCSY